MKDLTYEAQIRRAFTYHPPKPDRIPDFTAIRDKARELADLVAARCPRSREASVALTKIEESVMWANAAIARDEAAPATPAKLARDFLPGNRVEWTCPSGKAMRGKVVHIAFDGARGVVRDGIGEGAGATHWFHPFATDLRDFYAPASDTPPAP